ncbi:hypothetical protein [Williamsia maris]|uniref:Uncharacterized protein n=1 Tax=Williamsia maris TaxID=72806 RepID=A0ABT1HC38_9NOCA|nr:hypothetical protein [Williamsia maris]MCP2175828.1 hypothetical protein [Williamsia maris]
MTAARTATTIAGTFIAIAATATIGTGTASAATGITSTTVYTLASQGFCAGELDASLGHYPDQVDLQAGGVLVGVAPCSLDVDFVFTSRADGHVTTFTRHLTGPGPVGLPGRDVVSPGKPGVYDVTVKPRAQFVGGQKLTIDTEYRG